MNRALLLGAVIVGLYVVFVSVAPAVVALVHSVAPFVLVVGLVAILVRLTWWFTGRW